MNTSGILYWKISSTVRERPAVAPPKALKYCFNRRIQTTAYLFIYLFCVIVISEIRKKAIAKSLYLEILQCTNRNFCWKLYSQTYWFLINFIANGLIQFFMILSINWFWIKRHTTRNIRNLMFSYLAMFFFTKIPNYFTLV